METMHAPLLAPVNGDDVSSSSPRRPSFWSRVLAKKPLHAILAEEAEGKLDRSLELSDLLAIGIGGTVGSGIFVTAGLIAHCWSSSCLELDYRRHCVRCVRNLLCGDERATSIRGIDLCIHLLRNGRASSFYSRRTFDARIRGTSAAVARSWGDKVAYAAAQAGLKDTSWLNSQSGSLMSGLVQAGCVALLMGGMNLGKRAIKVATIAKVILVIFMIIVGASIFDSSLLKPLIPPEHEFVPSASDRESGLKEMMSFGMTGIFAGATQAFFGFVGFDEVCCMAAQTKDSRRIMPIAVLVPL